VTIGYIALIVLYVFICFFLILVVLVQQGRGADIAGAFGGGGTQTAFGARGATTLLHKLTTGAFIGFILLSLALTVVQARQRPSVVRSVPQKANAQGAVPAVPKAAPAGGVQATGQKPGGAPVSAQAPAAPAPNPPPAAPAQAPAPKK
jgi:preprotein translocase subunit SecG